MAAKIEGAKFRRWRRVWRNSKDSVVPKELVEELLAGPPSKPVSAVSAASGTSARPTSDQSNRSESPQIKSFLDNLERLLDVDAAQAQDIFRHYLSDTFEDEADFIRSNVSVDDRLHNVWNFYGSERLFMLRTLRAAVEADTGDGGAALRFDRSKTKAKLLERLELLAEEAPPSKENNGDGVTVQIQNSWIKRNLNERLEILLTLLVTLGKTRLSPSELGRLFNVFKSHSLSKRASIRRFEENHSSVELKVTYAQVAVFFKIIQDSKGDNAIIDAMKDVIEGELIRLQHDKEHGALLLAWMVLLCEDTRSNQDGDYLHRCLPFGTKALQLGAFQFLYEMIRHPMFSIGTQCAAIFRNSMYRLMCTICDKFDDDGSLATHVGAVELCGELLSGSIEAADFWSCMKSVENQGIVSIWNTALEFFPFDFKTLSVLISGLATASNSSHQNVMKELNDLPMFTVVYRPRMVPVCNINDEENVVLASKFYPYSDENFVILENSQAAILDRRNTTLIHFRTMCTYWNVLTKEINNFIDASYMLNPYEIEEQMKRLTWGIRSLNHVLKKNEGNMPSSLSNACEAVFELFIKFSHPNTPCLPLISECIQLCALLIPKFTKEIFVRLMHIDLLPRIDNVNLSEEQYAEGMTFSSSLVGHFLVNFEQIHGKYDILLSYLDILMAFFKCNYDDDIARGILLPGVVFVLREVFPHISSWNVEKFEEKQALQNKCLIFLFNILNLSPDQTSSAVDHLLNRICLYSFLNLVNGATLLSIISFGENNIQSLMEEEPNWESGPGVDRIKNIQIAMSALMQILRLKYLIKANKSIQSPLEKLIYTQPRQKDALSIVPIVTGYMNHIYNKNLPNTACSLLKRFALESHMSLLVCLDMAPHRIRTMFLDRLRDESESDILKTTILDFVATCVEKQPGLTEVFFKVTHVPKEKALPEKASDKNGADGILSYMAEFLSAVKDNTGSLYNPLLSRIMNLFHALWKNNMQMLVDDLKSNSNFWEYFCSPLFQDILPNIKAYSQIFNMIGIETFLLEGHVNEHLQSPLEKLFNRENKHLKLWMEYIFHFRDRGLEPETVDEVPTWLSLLASWKNFISIFIKFTPFPIHMDNKYLMSHLCMEALNRELSTSGADNRAIIMLSELYSIYFSNWKLDCLDDWQEFEKQITALHTNASASFESLHYRAKYSILAVCTLSLNILSDMKPEKELSLSIFHSVCLMNNFQLDKLPLNGTNDNKEDDSESNSSLTMGFKLLERAVYVFKDSFHCSELNPQANILINKLVIRITESIHKEDRSAETITALNCLTAFARNNLSKIIVFCNISQNLWLKFLPPRELLEATDESSGWRPNKWWQVYKSGIDMVTAILQNQGYYFSSDAILFAGIQEEYLIESILLIRQTLDVNALDLSHSALSFLIELIKFNGKWKIEHNQSLNNLVRAICMCLHYCITLILRPTSICLLIEAPLSVLNVEETENAGPSPKVVAVLNKLLELMQLSAVALRSVSPNVLSLLTDTIEFAHWQPLMELQFGSPKISSDPFPPLTFGTVMSGVCLLVRSLNYNYHAEDIPLNAIRGWSRRTSLRRRVSGSGGSEDGARRRSLRSDSVTSVSSTTSTTVITSNWLAALDKRLALFALENLLTLLGSQSLLAIKDPRLALKDKQVVRRELCAELPIFHDFVKKKIIESSHPKNFLSRRKHGIFPLLNADDDSRELQSEEEAMDGDENLFTPPPLPRKRSNDSMRVSVVRKLHLDKTKHGEKESMPKDGDSSGKQGARSAKHVTWDEFSLASQEEPTSPKELEYCILSEVQMVEEDYLHFLSILFLYICQTDN